MSDSADVPTPLLSPRERAAEALFGQTPGVLHCILDGARDERIYPRLRTFATYEEIVPLYQGETAVDMAAVAPYLIRLPARTRFFNWLWAQGWGEAWGIFFRAEAELSALRDHFRRLTNIRTEDGAVMMFRFYDPRVLAMFLPTCDETQVAEVFGPVQVYLLEGRSGRTLEVFAHGAGSLTRSRVRLAGD
jgi:hypothetical protein